MRNVKLGRQVLDHVVVNPDEFNMGAYGTRRAHPCLTVACLAGRTLLLSGYTFDKYEGFRDPDGNRVRAHSGVARNLLGLTDEEYNGLEDEPYLFSASQTDSAAIERFRVIVEKSEVAETYCA